LWNIRKLRGDCLEIFALEQSKHGEFSESLCSIYYRVWIRAIDLSATKTDCFLSLVFERIPRFSPISIWRESERLEVKGENRLPLLQRAQEALLMIQNVSFRTSLTFQRLVGKSASLTPGVCKRPATEAFPHTLARQGDDHHLKRSRRKVRTGMPRFPTFKTAFGVVDPSILVHDSAIEQRAETLFNGFPQLHIARLATW
jgi:hypothetical protein